MTERAASGPGSALAFTVGDWLAQPGLNRISKPGETSRLRPQFMNLLVCLAAKPA